jgi:hypothetical protein
LLPEVTSAPFTLTFAVVVDRVGFTVIDVVAFAKLAV